MTDDLETRKKMGLETSDWHSPCHHTPIWNSEESENFKHEPGLGWL